MAVYTTDHSAAVVQTHGWRTATNSCSYLLPHIKPDMKILDIGCGPGSISVDFARRVPQGHVTGIEYVSDPLDQARALAAREGVTNIDFRVGDIHALNFPDNSFDIVHVHQVLQHVADPVQALREMRRVTKSIVAARESADLIWYPENEGVAKWYKLAVDIASAKGGNPHPGRAIHAWAAQAGFDRARIQKSTGTWCFSTPEERRYWGGTHGSRVTSSGSATIAVEGGYATKEELEEAAKGWKDWVDNEDGWFGILHGEIVCWK
ncbi:putative UbiE/COQ5 family methyltransferase [Rhizodiscina lignyota]|uniref:UbiE/COQ5 family methyltransferase n=1 Tax=Rhizodiscina lignyota TaxID=1504668 RepID=A0A9P4IA43_9PEZI|nr:putative UbiE/COQ5 family methyltransferase [Rhizodiscina lignyota]